MAVRSSATDSGRARRELARRLADTDRFTERHRRLLRVILCGMKRPITGYHFDEKSDPVAELSCGHGQHVRHQPPMFSRPWVTTAEGRGSMLGTELDCVRCDRAELPEHFVPHRRTPDFDETSIPAGLRKAHTTQRAVWGVIHVLSGRLRYVIEGALPREVVLEGPATAIIVPEVPHHVEPDGPVRFYLELHRAPTA